MECFKKNVIILYVQPIIVVTLSFVAVILFGGSVFSRMNSLGIINSSLEAILFILISACLSRTKNNSLVTLETGFLLLIAFNLMHRFSYLTGHYTKIFDAVWILSLMIIFLGLGKAHAKRNKEIEFFSIDSIHSITSAIFVSFATFLFTLFIMIDFAISSVELGTFEAANVLPQNIPVILIFSYILTLLISRVVANFVKKPLDYLYKKINMVYKGGCENLIYSNKKLDVFEINELEKFTLHTLEQLQAANRIKADFLMNMSHDFRTPASGIYQMAGYVYKKLEKTELSSYMKLIVDSSGQLINLLDDVLDYSRLDNGKWELSFEKFDLAEVIRDVVLCLSAKAKEKSLKINSHFCSESFYYVGDKLAINRVILNLISNAIKFTDMGSVSVMLKKQVINNKSWVLVEIEDTGIGIAPQYHRVIFEPFIRIASAENAKYPGIGLGLSNASLVVEKMQGKITIRSALNVGSTFSIYLPLGRENDEKIP